MSVGGRTAHPDTPRSLLRRELAIWLAMFAIYVALTSIEWAGRQRTAVSNGRWLFDLERSLHIDIELALNNWLVPRDALRIAANYEYALTYIISSFGLLVWLYLRRPAIYRWARTSFILLNIVSLVCFAVYPVAPPRLVTDLGFTDTVVLDHTWGSWGSPLVSHANQLAAMPSLHIAWALWVSLILATIASGMLAQTVSGVHVMVTLLVIMATANHYLIDAAGGVVVAVASVAFGAAPIGRLGALGRGEECSGPEGGTTHRKAASRRCRGGRRGGTAARTSDASAPSPASAAITLATAAPGDHAHVDWSRHTSSGALADSDGEAPPHALMA